MFGKCENYFMCNLKYARLLLWSVRKNGDCVSCLDQSVMSLASPVEFSVRNLPTCPILLAHHVLCSMTIVYS